VFPLQSGSRILSPVCTAKNISANFCSFRLLNRFRKSDPQRVFIPLPFRVWSFVSRTDIPLVRSLVLKDWRSVRSSVVAVVGIFPPLYIFESPDASSLRFFMKDDWTREE